MKHCTYLLAALALSCAPGVSSAQLITPDAFPCDPLDSLIQVRPIHDDSVSSSFLICIPRSVRPHYHRTHTEHVTVLEGHGVMQLGDSSFTIGPGHCIVIPAGVAHAAQVSNGGMLRVLSVQSPHFDGTDRVFVSP